jgi:hypothetical protein
MQLSNATNNFDKVGLIIMMIKAVSVIVGNIVYENEKIH